MHKSALFVPLLAAIAAPAQDSPITKLIDTVAPSVVTVRVVAEIELPPMMGGEKQETKQEALGIVVDKSGLIMVPTSATDPGAHLKMMFGDEAEVTSTVTSLKVVVGNETKELVAAVVANDEKIGVSYVKITELGDRQLTPLSFDAKGTMALGASVYAVRRLAESFDFAPCVRRLEVSGQIKKPRPAWALSEGIEPGSPLFDASGALCGFVAHIDVADKGAGREAMMMRMFGGGGGGGPTTFAVAPQVVANSIAQALEAAQKGGDKKGDEKKPEEKKDDKKAGGDGK